MRKRAIEPGATSRREDAPQRSEAEAARETIEALAYRKYLDRGRVHGHDVDDWLEAERELNHGAAVPALEMFGLYEKRTA